MTASAYELTNIGDASLAAWLAVLLALVMGSVLRRSRGATLAAPAAWAVAAATFFALVEAVLAWRGDGSGALAPSLARYAAAAGSCCPLIAVLGAKRPQDRGWQWVVLSLWIVLLVPAGQAWAARAGGPLELSGAWRVMLGSLIGLGLLNYLPTRHGPAALLFASGQLALFSDYLFAAPLASSWHGRVGGLVLILLAILIAALPRRRILEADMAESGLAQCTERWRSFRDGWGAFWGLRVLQRINETAELSHWPVRLEWGGFVATPVSPGNALADDEPLVAQIKQTMDTLLRRFERRETAQETVRS